MIKKKIVYWGNKKHQYIDSCNTIDIEIDDMNAHLIILDKGTKDEIIMAVGPTSYMRVETETE